MHKNTAVNKFINKVIGIKWVDRACTFYRIKNNNRLSIKENDNSK